MTGTIGVFLCGIDPSLGRLDYESLPQQALIEMVISQMSEENQNDFKDENGNFLDVKEWEGVVMNDDSSIQNIGWSLLNVAFPFPEKPEKPRKIQFEWLPESVEIFQVINRALDGELDCKKLPKKLREFSVVNNRLAGTLVLSDLPEGIEEFEVACNFFTGSIDLTSLPKHLNRLILMVNDLSGTIDLCALQQSMIDLYLCKNRLSGEIDLFSLPLSFE